MRLSAIYLLAIAALAADTNWPQFRGPSASGVGTGSPPIEWNVESGKNILWKTTIPGSSPVAAGGRLYITNEEGHNYVLALGPEYKLLAENELGETVMATPAISGDVLYIRGGRHLFAIGAKR